MPTDPNPFSGFPTTLDMLLRTLMYTAGVVLSALGGFHGYRMLRGTPSAREEAKAERLRDEIVFGDDLDEMYKEDAETLVGDTAYKRTLAGDAKPNKL